MNVLILGGSGYIGSTLVKKMMNEWEITVVDNFAYGNETFEQYPQVKFVKESIRCLSCFKEYLDKADIIINFTCVHLLDSQGNPILDLEINTKAVLSLLVYLKENPDKGYIHISTGSIYHIRQYHSAMSHYVISKYAGELYTQLYLENGLKAAIVRPFYVYGAGKRYRDGVVDRFVKQALAGEPYTIHKPGNQNVTPTHVKDVANIIIEIVRQDAWRIVYDAVGSESFSIGGIADLIDEVLGIKNERVWTESSQDYGSSQITVYPFMIERVLNYYQPYSLRVRLQQMVDKH